MNFVTMLNQSIDDWQQVMQSDYGAVEIDLFMDRLSQNFGTDPRYNKRLGHLDAKDHSRYQILPSDQVLAVIARATKAARAISDDDATSLHYAQLLSQWYRLDDSLSHRKWNMAFWDGNGQLMAIRSLRSKDVTALLYRLAQ